MLTKKRTTSLQSDLAVYRARVADLERREENLKYEEQQRKQRELDLQRLREQKRKEEEKEAKTKRFFEVNRFNRRIAAPNEPVFFGDFESKYVAWRPHGQGEFSMNGAPILKGTFTHGDYVFGEITWENGQVWRGRVRNNCMQGPGTLTNGSDCAHVIMRDNVVVCKLEGERFAPVAFTFPILLCVSPALLFSLIIVPRVSGDEQPDLRPGTQLALFGGIPGQSCDRVDHTGRCLVNIVRHDHDWYFLCRFHEEVHPRERIVSLREICCCFSPFFFFLPFSPHR